MKDPEIANVIERLGENPTSIQIERAIEPIRSRLISELVRDEVAAEYPGMDVVNEVKILEERPGADLDDYMRNSPHPMG